MDIQVLPEADGSRPAGAGPGADRRADVWVIAVDAATCPAEERARFAETAARVAGPPDRALLVTCHRAELYGVGPQPALASLVGPGQADRLRVVEGAAAVRHVFRLAAGLESAVIGEDQVLHQVRESREAARARGRLDPGLARLLESASGVGRRARSARARVGPARRAGDGGAGAGLAGPAFDWLAGSGVALPGADVLVVGAGEMGRLLVHEARHRGARALVASRDRDRAALLAGETGVALDLDQAVAAAERVAAIAIALRGPWSALGADPRSDGERLALPPLVDLSATPAVPPGFARAQVDIDGLFRWAARTAVDEAADTETDGAAGAYTEVAEGIAEEAVARYMRWAAGRASVQTLRALRARAEARRVEGLDQLLRRVPALAPRERELVEAFSEQLVAGILHAPSARLREDADGAAAAATRHLFDL